MIRWISGHDRRRAIWPRPSLGAERQPDPVLMPSSHAPAAATSPNTRILTT